MTPCRSRRGLVTSVFRFESQARQQLNLSKALLRRILHKDLGIKPYKVQLVQDLKAIDHPMSFCFVKWACDRLTEDADFGKKKKISIIISRRADVV